LRGVSITGGPFRIQNSANYRTSDSSITREAAFAPISHGLIQSLREKHINVVDIKPDRDKQSRLISQIDLFEGGSVLLPKDALCVPKTLSELMT
jgi:phage terminase large subunit-like protein